VTQRCKAAGHSPRHVGLHGHVAVDVYPKVTDVLSWLDVVGTNAQRSTRDPEMLLATGSTPECFCFCCVQL